MNWDAIGAMGESLSAILVLITLIYLATQVRYAKNTAADTNRLARAKGVCDYQLACATNDLLTKGLVASSDNRDWYEELSGAFGINLEEAVRLDSINLYWFWLHWGQHSSTNSTTDLEELGHTIGMFYSSSAAITYSWVNSPFAKPLLGKQFVEFVDSHIKKCNAAD